jgi:hypothetical protein
MAAELGEAFSFEGALRHGLLPVVVGAAVRIFNFARIAGYI